MRKNRKVTSGTYLKQVVIKFTKRLIFDQLFEKTTTC
jgi:hypothetical protein